MTCVSVSARQCKPKSPRPAWDRVALSLAVTLICTLILEKCSLPALAQNTRYEMNGHTWLDLKRDGARNNGEPLLGEAEVWSGEPGSIPSNRSRSSANGRYTHTQSAPGTAELFALVAGFNDGGGRWIVLLAPPQPVIFRQEPTQVDLGLFEPPKPHDERYFPETGHRISDGRIWEAYRSNGGVAEFGRPLSDPFIFTCCWMQIFEYDSLNIVGGPHAVRMNVLDPEILGVDVLDGVRVPSYAPSLPGSAPWPPDPVCNGGPGGFIGQTVGQGLAGPALAFLEEYLRAAAPDDATLFRAYCLDGLERWGLPTSRAVASLNGDGGVMQRFQRGVMWYQPDCGCVRRVPYGETLRRVLRGDDAGFPELRSAAVFGLFAPELLYEPPAVHVNRAVGILATGGPTR